MTSKQVDLRSAAFKQDWRPLVDSMNLNIVVEVLKTSNLVTSPLITQMP